MSMSTAIELLHNSIAEIEYLGRKILGYKIKKCTELRTLNVQRGVSQGLV